MLAVNLFLLHFLKFVILHYNIVIVFEYKNAQLSGCLMLSICLKVIDTLTKMDPNEALLKKIDPPLYPPYHEESIFFKCFLNYKLVVILHLELLPFKITPCEIMGA